MLMGKTMKKFITAILIVILVVSGSGLFAAEKKGPLYESFESSNPNVEEYVWKEQDTEIPPFPKDEDLIEFKVMRPNISFTYYIDANSLSYKKEDGIVRYTVVIRSKSGANNVAFEGMRCTTKEFKTYAFGNGKGQFIKPRRYEWKAIVDSDYTRYRKDLAEFYFCNIKILDVTEEKILTELKYGRAGIDPGAD